jgi:hypothetical protein
VLTSDSLDVEAIKVARSKQRAKFARNFDLTFVIFLVLFGMEAAMGLKRASQQIAVTNNVPAIDATRTQIRWLIRRDMDEVLSIEQGSFQYPVDRRGIPLLPASAKLHRDGGRTGP